MSPRRPMVPARATVAGLLCAAALLLGTQLAAANPFKDFGHAVKDGAKTGGRAVKAVAKDFGRAVKGGFKGGVAGVKSGVRAGG